MRISILVLLCILLIAACQPAADDSQLPTLAVLPSLEATEDMAGTAESVETALPTSTFTPRPTNTPTQPTATQTPIPSPTFDPTLAANLTATAAIEEAPVLATVTPRSVSSGATDVPQVLADVVITERQFQEAVSREIEGSETIQRALVDFVPEGIKVQLTAQGGQAFITGDVFISIQVAGTFAAISIGDITVNAPEPPEEYIEIVQTDFFFKVVDALDSILAERLGEEHNLENIVMTNQEMQITLLVPES